jgi:hypothetical protein
MDKEKIQMQANQTLKETGIIDTLISIYAKKLGITEEDAKKVIDRKASIKLKNIVSLFDTNVTADSIKNKNTNTDLDEYLKSKPIIKG